MVVVNRNAINLLQQLSVDRQRLDFPIRLRGKGVGLSACGCRTGQSHKNGNPPMQQMSHLCLLETASTNDSPSRASELKLAACAQALLRADSARSEEHTSELQSHLNLVCRLLL